MKTKLSLAHRFSTKAITDNKKITKTGKLYTVNYDVMAEWFVPMNARNNRNNHGMNHDMPV